MKVLVACEFSGIVREAFRARGHDAWSCDIRDTEQPGQHIIEDVHLILEDGWDLMIAHPPCTYLCSSGLHWNSRTPGRDQQTHEAMLMVFALMDCPIPKIALENPIGRINTAYRKPDQRIQPWQFGHDASKGTCLWLKNLPLLRPTSVVQPRMVGGKPRWGNQMDSGQNKLGETKRRADDRSRTYTGIAWAMAEQWG